MGKVRYQEGDVFAVTLRGEGWCLGVVARKPKGGKVLLGYFFGPRLSELPTADRLPSLSADQARRIAKFGDLYLIDGKWPIVGHIPDWDRTKWPMPRFVLRDPLVARAVLITYAEDNPAQEVAREPCPVDISGYEKASLWGAGFAEAVLDKDM